MVDDVMKEWKKIWNVESEFNWLVYLSNIVNQRQYLMAKNAKATLNVFVNNSIFVVGKNGNYLKKKWSNSY
jgi:hypothetical protein